MEKKRPILRGSSFSMLLGALGGGLGAVIILYGYPFENDSASKDFLEQPEFLLWLSLIMGMTALMTMLVVPLWRSLKPYKSHSQWVDIILASIIMLILVIAPIPAARALSPIPSPDFKYHSQKMIIVTIYWFIAILPAAIGIWMIRATAQSVFSNVDRAKVKTRQVYLCEKFILLRENLQRYVSILGILVGLITLATGALRNVQLAMGLKESEYPLITVMAYGLYFTLLLALIYAPCFLTLQNAGRKLRDLIVSLDQPDSLIKIYKKRKDLNEILQLEINIVQSLYTGIAILAPLLSSLFSSILDLKI